jgi:hypothetical protein
VATLVDAVPGLLSADWAAAVVVPADWARGGDEPVAGGIAYASWRAPDQLHLPDVSPLRPRAFDGADEVRYATAPFGRAGAVLVVARAGIAGGGDLTPAGAGLCAPDFHVTEVDRLAQLVRASGLVLGDRLDLLAASLSGVAR